MSQTTSPQIRATAKELELKLKTVDEDRWLATRYSPKPIRSRLVAFYCLVHELDRALTMSEPMLGHIRVQWWREVVEQIYSDQSVRSHDLALALKEELGSLEHLLSDFLDLFEVYDDVLEKGGSDHKSRIEAGAQVSATAFKIVRLKNDEHLKIVENCGRAYIASRLNAENKTLLYDLARRDFKIIPIEFGGVVNHVSLVPAYVKSTRLSGIKKRWLIFKAVCSGRIGALV